MGPPDGLLRLRQGPLETEWLPGLGACCVALRHHAGGGAPPRDILRPLPPGGADPFLSGCFALLPYANRLFGQVLLAGAEPPHTIALNRAGQPHPVHGIGWMRPWRITDASAGTLQLDCAHAGDAHWPFALAARMTIHLSTRALRVELALRNADERPMPAGIGLHPWLLAEADAQLRVAAREVWIKYEAGVPLRRMPAAGDPRFDLGRSRPVHGLELDHCYADWGGQAELRRPAAGLCIRLSASEVLDHLQVYRPPGQAWVCVEPVSHAVGALSLPPLQTPPHGARLLAPGATLSGWMEIAVDATDVTA